MYYYKKCISFVLQSVETELNLDNSIDSAFLNNCTAPHLFSRKSWFQKPIIYTWRHSEYRYLLLWCIEWWFHLLLGIRIYCGILFLWIGREGQRFCWLRNYCSAFWGSLSQLLSDKNYFVFRLDYFRVELRDHYHFYSWILGKWIHWPNR